MPQDYGGIILFGGITVGCLLILLIDRWLYGPHYENLKHYKDKKTYQQWRESEKLKKEGYGRVKSN